MAHCLWPLNALRASLCIDSLAIVTIYFEVQLKPIIAHLDVLSGSHSVRVFQARSTYDSVAPMHSRRSSRRRLLGDRLATPLTVQRPKGTTYVCLTRSSSKICGSDSILAASSFSTLPPRAQVPSRAPEPQHNLTILDACVLLVAVQAALLACSTRAIENVETVARSVVARHLRDTTRRSVGSILTPGGKLSICSHQRLTSQPQSSRILNQEPTKPEPTKFMITY